MQPTLHNGIIRWTPRTLFLHLLWSWQFVVCLTVEYILIVLTGPKLFEPSPLVPTFLLLLVVNTLVAVDILFEVCLFANSSLPLPVYFILQVLKTGFYVTLFVLRAVHYQNWSLNRYEGVKSGDLREAWYVIGRIVEVVAFFPPWLLALGYAIYLLSREGKRRRESKGKWAQVRVVVTPADEETRLLE